MGHFLPNTLPDVWSSPEVKGERPPPCAQFTLTKVDQHRAIQFGGRQPSRNMNNVYLFNFRNMVNDSELYGQLQIFVLAIKNE